MEAYAADGWRGASREKVKPVAEIKRAKDQVGCCFLASLCVLQDAVGCWLVCLPCYLTLDFCLQHNPDCQVQGSHPRVRALLRRSRCKPGVPPPLPSCLACCLAQGLTAAQCRAGGWALRVLRWEAASRPSSAPTPPHPNRLSSKSLLCYSLAEGDVPIPSELFDEDGELDLDHIFCSKCRGNESDEVRVKRLHQAGVSRWGSRVGCQLGEWSEVGTPSAQVPGQESDELRSGP